MGLTEAQLAMRRTAIGGSEIAVLAGFSRWTTPIRIYEAKTTGVEIDATLPMELGNLLEEPIAGVYRTRTGRHTTAVGTLRHPSKKYAVATPDRGVFLAEPNWGSKPPSVYEVGPNGVIITDRGALAEAERLLEIKSTTWRMASEWGTPGTDEVAEYYLLQAQWQMGVADVKVCDFAVLFDKDRFETYTVHFNAELFEGLYEIAARFMRDHVEAGRPPEPDASDAYAEYLSRVFPNERASKKGEVLPDAPMEVFASLQRFAVLKAFAKKIDGAVKLEKNRIAAALGELPGFAGDWGKLTFKRAKDTIGTDWQAVAREAQEIAYAALSGTAPAEAREKLIADLRTAESRHRKITRKGGRRMVPTWDDGFLAHLPTTLDLQAIEAGEVDGAEDES